MKIYLQDRRRFSSIKILNEEEHKLNISKLGINIISENFTFKNFMELTKKTKRNICSFLLDQKKFAGLGNYIKNDVLYLSKVSPFRKVNNITDLEFKRIYNNIKFVTFSNLVEWHKDYGLRLPKKNKRFIS